MKFLLSCCGSCSRSRIVHEEETRSLVPEETRSLVPEVRSRRGRKRGRLMVVRGGGGGEWRPSLSSISEDNVMFERVDKEQAAVGSERNLKRKKASIQRARSHHYREDVGRASLSAMVPAFSPTPFLF